MEKLPVVSVIVPNYNHSLFLENRFRSILQQTYRDFELIILDDCSTDNSKEIIEKYRHHEKVSHVIYNEVNSGFTFAQWNRGFELARGEYIWIAESDDWCEPTFLSEVLAPLMQDREVILSFCQSLYITAEMRIVDQTYADYLNQVIDGKEFVVRRMLGSNGIGNASMAVFRKDKISAIQREYLKMTYCGDWYFWVNLCLMGKTAVSGKYLNYYYRHNNNVSTGSTQKGLDFLEGNQVYHLILKSVAVSHADKIRALNIKTGMYLIAKNKFLNGQVKQQVLSSLYGLDPAMKSLMAKRMAILKFRKYMSAIIKKFVKGV